MNIRKSLAVVLLIGFIVAAFGISAFAQDTELDYPKPDSNNLPDGLELWQNMIASANLPFYYVAATWNDDAVHLLDASLNNITSFPAGSTDPNGIATDGELIYTGHFGTQEVIAYDFFGVEQFRWSATLSGLQGMELVDGELAVYRNGLIDFFDPTDGTLIRSIPSAFSVEGLAYDGVLLWQLADDLIGIDPTDGTVISTVPNAAAGCSFDGTGITANAPGQLVLGCTDGSWYLVSSFTGGVITSGNNGLDMYGLKSLPAADLAVETISEPDTVYNGDMVTYVFTTTNNGPAMATNVIVTDTIPTYTQFLNASTGCSEASGDVTCMIADLTINASETFTVSVLVEAPENVAISLLNVAEAAADEIDPVLFNNDASTQTMIRMPFIPHDCDVSDNPISNCSFELGFTDWITQDLADPFFPLMPSPAGVTSWSGFFLSDPTQGITTTINGFDGGGPGEIRVEQDVALPIDAAHLIFDYRAAWDLLSFSSPGAVDRDFKVHIEPAGGGTPIQVTPILTATIGTIITDTMDMSGWVDVRDFAGSAVRISFVWTVPQFYTGPAFAQLDNVWIETQEADLALTKSVDLDPVLVNDPLVYTLQVNNTGPDDAQGVVLTDTLPLSLTYSAVKSDQGTCMESMGQVTCTLGDIASGVDVTVMITATAPSQAITITNVANVAAVTYDPVMVNNQAMVETEIVSYTVYIPIIVKP